MQDIFLQVPVLQGTWRWISCIQKLAKFYPSYSVDPTKISHQEMLVSHIYCKVRLEENLPTSTKYNIPYTIISAIIFSVCSMLVPTSQHPVLKGNLQNTSRKIALPQRGKKMEKYYQMEGNTREEWDNSELLTQQQSKLTNCLTIMVVFN